MHNENTNTILIIDDSTEHIKILIALLEDLYDVYFAKSGKEGLEILSSICPDIILLDILMPEIDGFEVCRRIKNEPKWQETPIIFISAQGADEDETKGLEMGAIDYITKPFSPAIVRARINNHLQLRTAMQELKHLYSLALDANPITGLPGNNSITRYIENMVISREKACVIYTDIDNFKAYNDKYGFARGDEVIDFTSTIIQTTVSSSPCPDAFVGHVGGDDFILVIPSKYGYEVPEEIIRRFDKGIVQFYNQQDAKLRYIESKNRQGKPQIYPIMSLSIAGIDLGNRSYSTYLEVNDACAEMKKKAKESPGSTLCFDRRKISKALLNSANRP
ncbi:MAG: diguanylate cyclase response regulator [Desulfotalea sp.]|nr:MAG: diguanylate cyclase response regulator [Desulfotalea sp.]